MSTAVLPRWRVWFLATRPWSLTISIFPIILATTLAWQDGKVSILAGILMLLTSVLTHIGCNFTNDYFDHHSGVDIVQNEGQGRMLQEGHLTDGDLRNGMIASFALALIFGAPIIADLGWTGVLFALVGAGVAFLYTGGPWPLAYNRMGEIGVFVAMGLVMVGGAYYVHTSTVTWQATILATSVGLYAAAILHGNNLRDINVDKAHRKHTLANTFGWTFGVREYGVLLFSPIVITVAFVAFQPAFWPLLVVLLLLPQLLAAWRMVSSAREGTLTSAVVGLSAKVHMNYTVLVIVGLLVKGIIEA